MQSVQGVREVRCTLQKIKLDLCEGGGGGRSFSTAIYKSDIQVKNCSSFSCFTSVCPFVALQSFLICCVVLCPGDPREVHSVEGSLWKYSLCRGSEESTVCRGEGNALCIVDLRKVQPVEGR